jgi:hypothetical protein
MAFYWFLLGLGLAVALLNGVLWSTAWFLLRKAPPFFALGFWPLVSLAAGAYLANELNAFVQLHGRYRSLAIGLLIVCGIGGLAFGLLCAAFQPTRIKTSGLLLASGKVVRVLIAIVLLAVAFGLEIADRRLYPNQYVEAHVALRWVGFWCAMMGWVSAGHLVPLFRMNRLAWSQRDLSRALLRSMKAGNRFFKPSKRGRYRRPYCESAVLSSTGTLTDTRRCWEAATALRGIRKLIRECEKFPKTAWTITASLAMRNEYSTNWETYPSPPNLRRSTWY